MTLMNALLLATLLTFPPSPPHAKTDSGSAIDQDVIPAAKPSKPAGDRALEPKTKPKRPINERRARVWLV